MEQKKKIEKEHAMLIVNGAPLLFHKGMVVSENYNIENNVQAAAFVKEKPLCVASLRDLTLKVQVSTASPDYVYYGTLKESIRTLLYLFAARKNEEFEQFDKAFRGNRLPFVPKSLDDTVPWGLPAACAYVGFSISLACCVVRDFKVSTTPAANTLETWEIILGEVDISQFQQEYLDKLDGLVTVDSEPAVQGGY